MEDPGEHCTVPDADWDMGAWNTLPDIARLPDPVTMIDGSPVTTRSQWGCRRKDVDTDSWTVSYRFEREKRVDWEVPDLR